MESAPTVISSLRGRPENHFTDLLRGRKLAHFELEEPIGVGGMAAVIRARDTQLDRKVALKILPPEMAADPENVVRFEHEARAAARLDHENVARVYYFGSDQGLCFIAFEFVEGKNLRKLLDERGRIPVAEAVHFVLQIATGLAHAAERGVVHRDIKPSNIIVGEDGRAKLVDMGLARSLHNRASKDLTQSGVTLGTFDYISPEQALEPRGADVRSDIYSLGCTFYHMITGRPPVPEGTAARKLQFHQHGSPIDPRQLNPEIPDEVAAVLARMMAKEPSQRYQRPEFLVQHLLAITQKLSAGEEVRQPRGVLFLDSILPAPPKTHPLVVLGIGGLAVVVLVAILGVLPDPSPPAPGLAKAVEKQPGPKAGRLSTEFKAAIPKPAERAAPPIGPDAAPGSRIRNVQQLRQLTRDGVTGDFTLEPDGPERLFELGTPGDDAIGEGNPALVFRNADVAIRNSTLNRPVVRLTHDIANPYGKEWAAITLVEGRLLLRGIRFEIDARSGVQPMALFHVLGGQLILQHCEFVQKDPPVADFLGQAEARLSVLKVLADSSAAQRPEIEFHNCYFSGGQDALNLEEGARILLQDCVFAPYESPVQIAGRSSHGWETTLRVSECSWLLRPRPVITLDSQQRCSIVLERSVLSQLESEESPEGARATLLRLGARQPADRCQLDSKENYFHNLGTLVGQLGENNVLRQRIVDLADFNRDQLDQMRDSGSLLTEESPWLEANPLRVLDKLQHRAFVLKETALAAGARDVLGEGLKGRAPVAPTVTPETKPAVKPTEARELIVDGQENFKTLASAFGAAESDDHFQILLRLNGPVPLLPLEIGDKKVRIRADKDFHPVLMLNARHVPGADGEAALFKVHDGELALEQVEVQLDPLRQPVRFQSVVQVTGAGGCRLERCAVTLNGVVDGPRLGLVVVTDPTGAMMATPNKPARPGVPAIRLSDCFVRGQGDLLSLRASRPFELEARNSLAVLGGALLVSEGNRRDAGFTAPASVSLDHVTACVTQNVALLRSSPTNPAHVTLNFTSVSQCVFASLEGRPLLYLDGPTSEDDLRRFLTWRGQKNVYNTTGSMLVWQPLEMSMGMERMPQRCDADRWQRLWGGDDDQPLFNRVKFTGFPAERTLVQVVSADFHLEATGETGNAELATRGADPDRLPQPTRSGTMPMEE